MASLPPASARLNLKLKPQILPFSPWLNPHSASPIIERLGDSGHPLSDISVLYPEPPQPSTTRRERPSRAPAGALTGAATGGLAGGIVGLLAGIGALTIPGLGAFVAAGPIMTTLGGAAAGAATGGLVGGMIGLGIPESEARQYESKLRLGNYLVSVHVHGIDDADQVKAIYRECGAEDIGVSRELRTAKAA
jgi:hypothetical protein